MEKKVTISIDEDLWYKVKILSLQNKTSVKDFVTNTLKEKIEKDFS